ncbi:MAG: DUF1549 domain-containing protein, partial [Planctomycetes bacterium]|nr:DUF1549 domain-containing protein [Planctomycetota bacterium]
MIAGQRFSLDAIRLMLAALAVTSTGFAATADDDVVDYARDVKPLLKNKCYACHGRVKQEAGLRLDAGRLVLAGGDDGKVVVPGKGTASKLIARVSSPDADERMPPEGAALSADQVALLRSWIDQGAKVPADETVAPKADRHWAFQPIRRVKVPQVKDKKWPLDAIDYFVLARLEQREWRPAASAKPPALLRRVYLDLIGLPPTVAGQQAFTKAPTREADRR